MVSSRIEMPPPKKAFENNSEKTSHDDGKSGKIGFVTYCEQTSLHGWQYFVDSVHKYWRIHWVFIVLLSIAVAIFFVVTASLEFQQATIITTIDSLNVPLSEVFFPAVTLCNINQIRRSFFHALDIDKNSPIIDLIYSQFYEGSPVALTEAEENMLVELFTSEAYIRRSYENLLFYDVDSFDINNQADWQKFLHNHQDKSTFNLSQEIDFTRLAIGGIHDHLILRGTYGYEKRPGNHSDFASQYGSDYGICVQFFPQIAFDDQYNGTFEAKNSMGDLVTKGASVGKENGLRLLVDAETFDYMYHLNPGEGFKLSVHHHKSMPIMSIEEIDIKPGGIFQIAVTPTLVSTSENAIERFTPVERNCYEEGELYLAHLTDSMGYRYDMKNCLFQSTIEMVIAECGCIPAFHMISDHEMCYGQGIICMNAILLQIGLYDTVNDSVCLASCEDQINALRVTSSLFPNQHTFEKREEFCLVYHTLKKTCSSRKKELLTESYPTICDNILIIEAKIAPDELCAVEDKWDPVTKWGLTRQDEDWKKLVDDLFQYARENIALINIYIKDPTVTRIIRDEKISYISFIANVGGLMGLCMGFSLVSSWEIIYHLLLKAQKYYQGKKPK